MRLAFQRVLNTPPTMVRRPDTFVGVSVITQATTPIPISSQRGTAQSALVAVLVRGDRQVCYTNGAKLDGP